MRFVRGLPLILQALVRMLTCFENYLPQPRLEAGAAQTSSCLEEAKAFSNWLNWFRLTVDTFHLTRFWIWAEVLSWSQSLVNWLQEHLVNNSASGLFRFGSLPINMNLLCKESPRPSFIIIMTVFPPHTPWQPSQEINDPPPPQKNPPTRWKRREEATFCGDIIVLSVPRRGTFLSSLDGLASKHLRFWQNFQRGHPRPRQR